MNQRVLPLEHLVSIHGAELEIRPFLTYSFKNVLEKPGTVQCRVFCAAAIFNRKVVSVATSFAVCSFDCAGSRRLSVPGTRMLQGYRGERRMGSLWEDCGCSASRPANSNWCQGEPVQGAAYSEERNQMEEGQR